MKTQFEEELRSLINRNSRENRSNTPDYILARFMLGCLETFEGATQERNTWWYGNADAPIGGDLKASAEQVRTDSGR